jgi:hypothetical protein
VHAQDAGNSQNKHHPLDETNLLANGSAPQNGSMPQVYAWANDPSQVVFIESDVPDLQDLLDGLAPGVEAFVLGPSSDGLRQIADILAANDLTDLSSISIVSHGGSGELELGSAIVTNANETDMLMRNSNTGAFELFNISNNTITPATGMGQIGLEWSISGVSATPASAPPSSATAQLTQAMASFAPSAGTAAASSPLEPAMAPSISTTLLTTNHA